MPALPCFTESRRSERGASRWPFVLAVLLVVAAAGVLYFVSRPAPPQPVVPAGRATRGMSSLAGDSARFVWSRDPRADIYRLEVYDLSSRLLAAAMLRDTTIPASAVLPETAHAGIWRVVPVSRGGTELPPSDTLLFERP